MESADPTRFILLSVSHPGNVGAAARAIHTMGFSQLVLVAPRFADAHQRPEALAMASGATEVLRAVRVVPTLFDALDGIDFVCATAMTPRDFGPPTAAPRAAFAELALRTQRLALVFGGERFGMSNEDVYRCHLCLSIPTLPQYGSLNLAQAVQLVAYEWRQALGGYAVRPRTLQDVRADMPAVERLLADWRETLTAIGYFDPKVPRKLLPRLQRLLNRARPTLEEVNILHGIARAARNESIRG